MNDKPVIGVIASSGVAEGETAQSVKQRYLEAVSRYAEAMPVIVPVDLPGEAALPIMGRLDGLLLTGANANIAPACYGSDRAGYPPVDGARDRFVSALIKAAITRGVPVFGICRGLQEINVALGGTLTDERDGSQGHASHHAPDGASLTESFNHFHEISVVPDTLLSGFAGAGPLRINSVHHQMIGRLAPGLSINASGNDGVIEAISGTGSAALVFAVQWHPEWEPATRAHDLAFWQFFGQSVRERMARNGNQL